MSVCVCQHCWSSACSLFSRFPPVKNILPNICLQTDFTKTASLLQSYCVCMSVCASLFVCAQNSQCTCVCACVYGSAQLTLWIPKVLYERLWWNQFAPSLKGSASVNKLSTITLHYVCWWTTVTNVCKKQRPKISAGAGQNKNVLSSEGSNVFLLWSHFTCISTHAIISTKIQFLYRIFKYLNHSNVFIYFTLHAFWKELHRTAFLLLYYSNYDGPYETRFHSTLITQTNLSELLFISDPAQ